MCDCYAHGLASLLQDKIRQPLRRLANGVFIHAVNARSDDSAQTAGAELQISIKALTDLFLIILNSLQFCLCLFVKVRILQPFPVGFHITHIESPPIYLDFHTHDYGAVGLLLTVFSTIIIEVWILVKRIFYEIPQNAASCARNCSFFSFCTSRVRNFSRFRTGIQLFLLL